MHHYHYYHYHLSVDLPEVGSKDANISFSDESPNTDSWERSLVLVLATGGMSNESKIFDSNSVEEETIFETVGKDADTDREDWAGVASKSSKMFEENDCVGGGSLLGTVVTGLDEE